MDTKPEDNSESSQSNTSGVIASEAQHTGAGTDESENSKRADESENSKRADESENSKRDFTSVLSPTSISSWAKNLKISQPFIGTQDGSPNANTGKSSFSRFTSGIGMQLSPKNPSPDASGQSSKITEPGLFGSLTKGFVESSRSAVKAVQAKARHAVSQNKRRYQEGGFDLDMTYITENIIAMGFPAGDLSSGFFGYVEGFYRNHMEEVIKFFETHHKDKYKVYNLCSERLYDASLFEGKVASFPFDDHNCPPARLIISFCQSAYSWLKEDIENVVVVHCKAGMARTGLMISSLLLYLKFFPTAEESIDYYNQKRCFDGKGLILPSQIRYVKYFERILTYFNGENPPGRRCMLRGFRLHRCPYWIRPSITVSDHNGVLFSSKKHPRTKDLSAEDFWFSAPKKGVMVFALPGEPGLTELVGDFKIHFHDRQGDFYCWLNTTMTENRKVLNTNDLDGFDKRKLPSPGFQVEVVLVDYNGSIATAPNTTNTTENSEERSSSTPAPIEGSAAPPKPMKNPVNEDKDDVFSDGEAEEGGGSSKSKQGPSSTAKSAAVAQEQVVKSAKAAKEVSVGDNVSNRTEISGVPKSDGGRDGCVEETPTPESEFKAMAADASVFTFGDEEDYESD